MYSRTWGAFPNRGSTEKRERDSCVPIDKSKVACARGRGKNVTHIVWGCSWERDRERERALDKERERIIWTGAISLLSAYVLNCS